MFYDNIDYVNGWRDKPWAYKQGWLSYHRFFMDACNPHKDDVEEYIFFEKGWNDADHYGKLEGGYFDQ